MWQSSRFESKYMIPPHKVGGVRRWIQMFIPPDSYAVEKPNYTYSINSLYLDSADLQLYRMTGNGIKNRFKLRIRCYDDNPSSPLFFEIKRRVDRIIRKTRVTLSRIDAQNLLHGNKSPSEISENGNRHHLESFIGLMHGLAAYPIVRVRYEREAYESSSNDRLRITLDRFLNCSITKDYNFSFTEGNWNTVSMGGTLLEIKFTDFFPSWLIEMIRYFELQKISFSKYGLSVENMRLPLSRAQRLFEGV